MRDAYSGNIENKMVDDSAWPRSEPEEPDECRYCGRDVDANDNTPDGICLMCFSDAESALDNYLSKETKMTANQREIMREYLKTI